MGKIMMLSIVVPAYNEEESVLALYDAISANASELVQGKRIDDWDVWFVDDGSTDSTGEILVHLAQQHERVHLISFAENSGKSAALQAGFSHAPGDVIITMDADLQDDPREFARFLDKLDEGYDLVSGWKRVRHDPLEKRLASKMFNTVTAKATGISLHDFNCGFKAYRHDVVAHLRIPRGMHRYIPVLAASAGFTCAEIEVEHHARKYGASKYGAKRYISGAFGFCRAMYHLKRPKRKKKNLS